MAIFGPGLIGGSLALALAQRPGLDLRIWTRESSLEAARKAFPQATDDARAVAKGAEILVFCTPAAAMTALAKSLRDVLSPTAVTTDAASVKGSVCRNMTEILGQRFVGAHPMAGSEQAGLPSARADLFEGATCFLTPLAGTESTALGVASEFWSAVGCRVREIDPFEHDLLVARSSHSPHAIASCLVRAVAERCPKAFSATGPGFRDTTRIAAGPSAMWAEIFLDNRTEVRAALGEFREALGDFEQALEAGNRQALEAVLEEARRNREALA